MEHLLLVFSVLGTLNKLYLGIWYNKMPKQTFVWVCNRKNPVTKNFGRVLKISNEGNLVILGGENVMWSSNILVSDVTIESPVAVLMHYILKNRNEAVLWQSFDYPTDTLLPGMKIGLNFITGHDYHLTSWKDYENPEPGPYSLSMDHRGPIQFVIRNMSDIYMRSNAWDGSTFIAGFLNHSRLTMYNTVDVNDAEMYLTLSISQFRIVLIPTGDVNVVYWVENSNMWILLRDVASNECMHYNRRGAFGICERGSSPPYCNCLPGFRPHSQNDWDMRNWSGGCVRHKELTCDERNEFLRLERVKGPDYSVTFTDLSMKECEMKCLWNCSCAAYAYVNSTMICLVWAGKLIDISDHFDGFDLYVRADETGLGNKFSLSSTGHSTSFINPRNWRIWVVLVLCITVAFVSLGSIYYRRTRNKKRRKTNRLGFVVIRCSHRLNI
ncbi:hypothetical protein Sjap_025434 [Stephania japonica]|uniref:Uncharacterized protein n=1 Tax=Stephania japonica TaxID=461633 RepID=A0AAP0E4U7_9MAGN